MKNIAFVEQKIFILRGRRVMLSTHLAELYGVEPRALVQAVKRNMARFPSDFMFQLTDAEKGNLKSQTGEGLRNSVDESASKALFAVEEIEQAREFSRARSWRS